MLNKKTKILYITGTRADYGIIKNSLLAINKICDLRIVVTGMHLEKKFGYTINEIKKDNLNVAKVIRFPYRTDKLGDLSKNLGYLLIQLTDLIIKYKFDYVLIEGDRMEALALAITANCNNIQVIHQGGGDVSGSIDDKIRNAITSFSDFHLVGNVRSAERLRSIGISKNKIFMFGEPGLDNIISKDYSSPENIYEKYKIDKRNKLILLVHHPDTKEKISPKNQVLPLLKAIKKLQLPTIIIYPNNDTGGLAMIREIDKYKSSPFIKTFPNLPREDLLGLMNICNIMVGNSSSGLVEAALFNLPFINLGKRQQNRLVDTNVINCDFNVEEITRKIKENIHKKGKFKIRYVYGHGLFLKKFVNFIKYL